MSGDQEQVILCPGQGAQHVGMGKSWMSHPVAADVFAQADRQLGEPLSSICFDGPEDRLNGTDIAQAAIYVTSIACLKALKSMGLIDEPAAAAGLSLGEYTALHLAGVFSFAEGLHLVWQRGRFMQEAATASASGMVAIIGAEEAQVEALCDEARGGEVLVGANYNCPGQIVISGSAGACERSLGVAEKMGLRATKLSVAGAFHSPLMQPAADRMAAALEEATFSPPRIEVMSNVTGEAHGSDVEEIRALLVRQITHPVRWEKNCRALLAKAGRRYIEPAPGKTLSGMMRRIDRSVKVEGFAEAPG